MLDLLLKALSAIAIAMVSSWITVYLSRDKFRSERWWEKKAAAYERVIEAFHKSKKFDAEHIRAQELQREMDDARQGELRLQAKEARDEILRASDVGSFILSENALSILAKYEAESENIPQFHSWYEHLDHSWSLTHRYMKEFIAEAHADLKRRA
jgi:hypothetical protein